MKKGFSDDTFLARWLAGKLKDEEQKILEERDDYTDYLQILNGVKELDLPSYSEEKSWKQLLAKKQIKEPKQIKKKKRWPIYWAAASIIIIIGIGIAILLGQQSYTTTTGQKLSINLPDASKVQLNVSSKVRYNSFLWHFGRKVSLKGEAFFEVKKGRSFKVITPTGEVGVLGTTFNVWAREQQLEVRCHSGKVKVSSAKKSEILQAGEKAVAKAGSIDRSTIPSIAEQPSWTKGISKFDLAPVKRIMEEMERQFDVQIVYTGDSQKELTFSFPNNDLDAALRLLSGALEASYKIDNNNKILIKPN